MGASEVDLAGWCSGLVERGLSYGPVFRGLRRAWASGGGVFAEVALPDEVAGEAAGFGVHPALLDAALHPVALLWSEVDEGGPRVPFAFGGVQVHASGAGVLRVRLTRDGSAVRLVAVDEAGAPVVSVDSLVLREMTGVSTVGLNRSLFEVAWPAEQVDPVGDLAGWAVVGEGAAEGLAGPVFADVSAVVSEVDAGRPAPRVLLLPVPAGAPAGADLPAGGVTPEPADLPVVVRSVVSGVLAGVRSWLVAGVLVDCRLVVVTRGAVAVGSGGVVSDLVGAAVWGLVRSAQSEHPGRIVLADVDGDLDGGTLALLNAVVADPAATGGQVAVRDGAVHVPRLVRAATEDLALPSGPWHVAAERPGTFDGVTLAPAPVRPLGSGEVRVGVRAAGVNFRDVLIALGMYPDPSAVMGSEGAGVVLEVGPDVTDLSPGDRVFGMFELSFGPQAVAQRERLARMPATWTFTQAASVPLVFLTAYYALKDLAGLRSGESVLVHSGAGGVG
ncbi:polyketide synthase dehydratase domain-containing protein, partial [Polymorphospora rubra]|uniref:polyketide synthase dehydratase domain-containing protein n=1 Tax=Polymorphospora rubra TaxID=338584 RepID=UPI0031D2815C